MLQHKAKRLPVKFGTELHMNTVPFSVRATQRVHMDYVIDVFDNMEGLSDVQDAITALNIAEENDTVQINLCSGGGSIDVADTLIHAMNKCKCPVHVVGSGTIASAATFVLLSASSFELTPHTSIMLHPAKYGTYGDVKDVENYVDFTGKLCKQVLHDYYKHFLTDQELSDLINHSKEMWMTAEEFVERYQRREAALNRESTEENIDTIILEGLRLATQNPSLSLDDKLSVVVENAKMLKLLIESLEKELDIKQKKAVVFSKHTMQDLIDSFK